MVKAVVSPVLTRILIFLSLLVWISSSFNRRKNKTMTTKQFPFHQTEEYTWKFGEPTRNSPGSDCILTIYEDGSHFLKINTDNITVSDLVQIQELVVKKLKG